MDKTRASRKRVIFQVKSDSVIIKQPTPERENKNCPFSSQNEAQVDVSGVSFLTILREFFFWLSEPPVLSNPFPSIKTELIVIHHMFSEKKYIYTKTCLSQKNLKFDMCSCRIFLHWRGVEKKPRVIDPMRCSCNSDPKNVIGFVYVEQKMSLKSHLSWQHLKVPRISAQRCFFSRLKWYWWRI